VLKIDEVRGRYILMVDKLLNEFNPEVAEEARKTMEIPITDITEDGWYNDAIYDRYLKSVNDEAKRVLGKKMVYAAGEAFDELVEMFEKPVDLIKFTIENDPKEDFKKENWYHPQVVVTGDDFIKIKLDVEGVPTFYEGVYQGMLEKYRIIRTNINTTVVEENGQRKISEMTIKWQ
jgi:hypothetical protein